ncbi:hypothetical protein MASR1M12_44380 [Erysipelotrichia bacterium]
MGRSVFTALTKSPFWLDEARSALPVARWRVAELQTVAYELTRKNQDDLGKIKEWLKVLAAPGSTLAAPVQRPIWSTKMATLWIAKFPSADDYDVALGRWRCCTSFIDCGITVPEARVVQIGGGYHTFMVKRFDRVGAARRFFARSHTPATGNQDSEDASYLSWPNLLPPGGEPNHINYDLAELLPE